MKKRNVRKRSNQRSAVGIMTGARMKWSAEDPLDPKYEVINPEFSHANPVYRLMTESIKRMMRNVINTMKLKWRIQIDVEFIDDDGKVYYKGSEIVMHCILGEGDGHYQDELEKIFAGANMRHYNITHLTAEILGNSGIKDSDFTVEATA